VGLMMVAVSFLLTKNLVQKAIDNNDISALQTAHILALALYESAALFGLVDRLATASNISWFLFAISAAGILMNFPSKDQIRSASYKP
jgi:F0F1-type ATP synthase membrane subunit c/vacuolar-type H+-ATPase subunit K